jgi:alpha-amylase
MKIKYLPSLIIFFVTVSACGGNRNSSSSSISTSTTTSASSSQVINSAYEATMTWAKAGHLYIHYNRSKENQPATPLDYADWGIWIWQKAPYDLPGVLVDWLLFDESGAIAEIDFTGATSALLGRVIQSGQTWQEISRVGFLIVNKTSMANTIGMWTSDGGTDMYINDFSFNIRANNTMHVFALSGQVSDFGFNYTGAFGQDPFANDTGAFTSTSNVNSSNLNAFPQAITSQDFYQHVGVGYQIFVRSFADSNNDGEGDLRGIIEKLDYLESLGVKALWLTPVQASETYHGYDVTDFYRINPSLGSTLDFAELIYKAKAKDMRIVMDLVVNHTSMQNPWFQNSINLRKGTNSAGEEIDYRSFYHWRYSQTPLQAPWHRFGESNYYYYGKFASSMPELNYDYQGTRDAMIDVAKYWAGFGVSGFRIDAVKHIYMADEVPTANGDVITEPGSEFAANRTKNINFFKAFNYALKSVYPNAFIVGENFDGWDQRIAPYYQGMDSQLDFQAYYHLMNMMFGINESSHPQAQASVFQTKFNTHFKPVREQFINGAFTSNHDVARVINWVKGARQGDNVIAKQTITAADYPDARARANLHNAATLLMPGTSWIYYGDELGMTGNWTLNPSGTDFHKDRWYRQPMKWDNLDNDPFTTNYSFEGYEVTWDAINANDALVPGANQQMNITGSMFKLIQGITQLKHQETALINGDFQAIQTGQNMVMAFRRQQGDSVINVYLNFGANNVNINASGQQIYTWNFASNASLPGYSILVTRG